MTHVYDSNHSSTPQEFHTPLLTDPPPFVHFHPQRERLLNTRTTIEDQKKRIILAKPNSRKIWKNPKESNKIWLHYKFITPSFLFFFFLWGWGGLWNHEMMGPMIKQHCIFDSLNISYGCNSWPKFICVLVYYIQYVLGVAKINKNTTSYSIKVLIL